jgi:hypothetical protein
MANNGLSLWASCFGILFLFGALALLAWGVFSGNPTFQAQLALAGAICAVAGACLGINGIAFRRIGQLEERIQMLEKGQRV